MSFIVLIFMIIGSFTNKTIAQEEHLWKYVKTNETDKRLTKNDAGT